MTCQQLIESLSEALEGRLPLPQRRRAETHLADCPDCVVYVESYRTTIAVVRGAYSPFAAVEPASKLEDV